MQNKGLKIWKFASEVMMNVSILAAVTQMPHINQPDHQARAVFFGVLAAIWYLSFIGSKFLLMLGE